MWESLAIQMVCAELVEIICDPRSLKSNHKTLLVAQNWAKETEVLAMKVEEWIILFKKEGMISAKCC